MALRKSLDVKWKYEGNVQDDDAENVHPNYHPKKPLDALLFGCRMQQICSKVEKKEIVDRIFKDLTIPGDVGGLHTWPID